MLENKYFALVFYNVSFIVLILGFQILCLLLQSLSGLFIIALPLNHHLPLRLFLCVVMYL